MFLVDTNVVSELRKPERAHPGVVAWARAVNSRSLYMSSITLMELELGVLLKERKDPAQGIVFREWLEKGLLLNFQGRIIEFGSEEARRAARLHASGPGPERDTMIAATALTHGMTVVTRNIKDFEPHGTLILNPWADN